MAVTSVFHSGGQLRQLSGYAALVPVSTIVPSNTDSKVSTAERPLYQIGEVAERVGLSLRTVRYYEEVGLLDPLARTQGHFRLFTERDIERLQMIMQMKPTGFTLEEMREQLEIRERLQDADLEPQARAALLERLAVYAAMAVEKTEKLRKNLAWAERLVAALHAELESEQVSQNPTD